MIYDTYDFEVLRLCGLCRYIPTDLQKRYDAPFFENETVLNLQEYKLIKMQNDELSYKLTDKGRKLLAEMGYQFQSDARMNINRNGYKRKVDSAKFTVLLHLAGINVFCRNLGELEKEKAGYIVKTELYGKYGKKNLAGTRFLGLLKIGNVVYIPYYIESDDDWIMPKYEQETFMYLTRELPSVKKVRIMLVGETLEELSKNVFAYKRESEIETGRSCFNKALEEFGRQTLWVPLNKEGVLQLNIMTICRYKDMVVAAMDGKNKTPECYSRSNGMYKNHPVIVLLDTNVKSIIPALKQAAEINDGQLPAVVVMYSYTKIIEKLLYRYNSPHCMIYKIEYEALKNVYKEHIKEFEQTAYMKNGRLFPLKAPKHHLSKQNDII